MSEYLKLKEVDVLPRLPLEGMIDLTYRCNNNCCHCWSKIPDESPEKENELTFEEITRIVEEARKMGCRKWGIAGGEPMLRPDFNEIFDYITRKSASYCINTNGTLITPKIAKLLKRKGSKLVSLYGATAEVHDHITGNIGSFEATMQGCAYLKESGAGFIVQLVPMKDNFHQFKAMIKLAEILSPDWRIGASWLFLSACGGLERNRRIMHQRLGPRDIIELTKPNLSYEQWMGKKEGHRCYYSKEDDRLFAHCIATIREFHIDPYGQMTFCWFIKDPALRYDLRKGSLKECWEVFIPSLADKVRGGKDYWESCGSCELRSDCQWCPAYAYLEHREFSSKVEYFCSVAKENRRFKEDWQKKHCRYYEIADITIRVESDLPIVDTTFHPKFKLFEVDGPGEDTITIRHHFSIPDLNVKNLGEEVYHKPPWAIYKKGNAWIYLGIGEDRPIHKVAVFNHDHTRVSIFNEGEEIFRQGSHDSLTLFPTDQILLSRVLADREGCYFHAGGVNLEGKGLLFMGHSEAGKSTMVRMLKDKAEILCDDRMIVRRRSDGFKIYGTWSHGDVPEISGASAPLTAILFIERAGKNHLMPLDKKQEVIRKLLDCLIKPFVTADWWDQVLSLLERMAREVPCYSLQFDKSGRVVDLL